jgi:hypothetical protein
LPSTTSTARGPASAASSGITETLALGVLAERQQAAHAAQRRIAHRLVQRCDVARQLGAQLAAEQLQRVALIQLDAGGVVDVDDVRAVEQEDDAVVELVQRRGKPVPHGLRHALAGHGRRAPVRAGSSDDGGMHSLRSGLGAGSCEHVPLLRCRCEPWLAMNEE